MVGATERHVFTNDFQSLPSRKTTFGSYSFIPIGTEHTRSPLPTPSMALRRLRLPLTKIVATIGPASEALPTLPRVVDAGMRLMRLNFSHATEDEVELRLKNLKLCPTAAPNQLGGGCAVLLDTQGPEIRTGGLRVVREQNNRRAKVTIEKGVGCVESKGLYGRSARPKRLISRSWPKLREV